MKNLLKLHKLLPGLLVVLGLFAGCSSESKNVQTAEDDEFAVSKAEKRISVLQARFENLNETLDQLERDNDLQKQRIKTARGEVNSIYRQLRNLNLKGYTMDNISTSAYHLQRLNRSETRNAEAEQKREVKKTEAKEEKRERKATTTLAILLSLATIIILVLVYLKQRGNRPSGTYYPYYEPKERESAPSSFEYKPSEAKEEAPADPIVDPADKNQDDSDKL